MGHVACAHWSKATLLQPFYYYSSSKDAPVQLPRHETLRIPHISNASLPTIRTPRATRILQHSVMETDEIHPIRIPMKTKVTKPHSHPSPSIDGILCENQDSWALHSGRPTERSKQQSSKPPTRAGGQNQNLAIASGSI